MTGLEERDDAAGAVQKAPRVSLDQIKTLIAAERYFLDETLTICVLTLTNGYKVIGESAAADPANFNAELGRKIAKDKATAEIWPLAGFLLRDRLHRQERPLAVRTKFVVSGTSPVVAPAADAEWDYEKQAYNKIGPDGANVTLTAVYENGGCPENAIFGKMTPFGLIQMHLRNPSAIAALPQGKAFFVDFTPAD